MVGVQAPPRKHGLRRRAGATVLAFGASVLGASWCRTTQLSFNATRWVHDAFLVPSTSVASPSTEKSASSLVKEAWHFENGRQFEVAVQASEGFAPAAAEMASVNADVEEPMGGWPMISVLVLNPDSKDSKHSALTQLAYQDYPRDRIKEVVISGATELGAGAPENLQSLLTDLRRPESASLNLHEEFKACEGEYVAVWGDDQVSPASRLRSQVAAAVKAEAPTLLKQNWFFDPEDYEFERVTSWPIEQFQEVMGKSKEGPSMDDFGPLMVYADPLTLCGTQDLLARASSGFVPNSSPNDVIKELLFRLLALTKPQIIEDIPWAALRAPPSIARALKDTPDKTLTAMAYEAVPRGQRSKKSAFNDALQEVQAMDVPASAAISKLLELEVKRPLPKADLRKVTKAVAQSLAKGKGADASAAVETLQSWKGLQTDGGSASNVKRFPLYYACFQAVRSHVEEDADLMEITSLGELAQGLAQLAMKIWAADGAITEVLVKLTAEELDEEMTMYGSGAERERTADLCGTLSLKKPMEAIAFAALDIPEERGDFPVKSLASLAWGLSEAGIENGGLQNKVAKSIINNYDKMSPSDIGYIFHAMNTRKWFKDDSAIEYLTKALVQRVQELKAQDAGIRQQVEDSAAAFIEQEKVGR